MLFPWTCPAFFFFSPPQHCFWTATCCRHSRNILMWSRQLNNLCKSRYIACIFYQKEGQRAKMIDCINIRTFLFLFLNKKVFEKCTKVVGFIWLYMFKMVFLGEAVECLHFCVVVSFHSEQMINRNCFCHRVLKAFELVQYVSCIYYTPSVSLASSQSRAIARKLSATRKTSLGDLYVSASL